MRSSRSYLKPFIISIFLFVITLGLAVMAEALVYQSLFLRYTVLLIPLIPLIFAAFYFSKGIGALDELQQRVQIEALAFGLGALVLVGIAIGLLQLADVPGPNWIWVTFLGSLFWGIGLLLASRKFR